MIKTLLIKQLFDEFDYNLSFIDGDVNILTGPNGFGKSTILRIIEAIAKKDLLDIYSLPFEELVAKTHKNKTLRIKKGIEKLYVNNIKLDIIKSNTFSVFSEHSIEFDASDYVRNILLSPSFGRETFSIEEEKLLTDGLIKKNYQAESRKERKNILLSLNQELTNFRNDVGDIKFIHEQRLLLQNKSSGKNDSVNIINAVNEIPVHIKEIITNYVLKYSEKSSQLDSTFPSRVMEYKIPQEIDSINQTLSKAANLQEKINDYKLLKKPLEIFKILDGSKNKTSTPGDFKIMALYFQDSYDKLSVFGELIDKLDAFVGMINSKLFGKKIEISLDNGLIIKKNNGFTLEPTKLSSGEQQILVLYYDLIFGADNDMLLMIDEPEISLHVTWQRNFLTDLRKCNKLRNKNITTIVCTHSPQIIDKEWQSIIDLGKKNEN